MDGSGYVLLLLMRINRCTKSEYKLDKEMSSELHRFLLSATHKETQSVFYTPHLLTMYLQCTVYMTGVNIFYGKRGLVHQETPIATKCYHT